MTTADPQRTPFIRELASSDRRARDKAVASLTQFLRTKTDLSLLELLKLWKGLYYCFYHSDRPLTQQALARTLSFSLLPVLPKSTRHNFLRAFWITISREFHLLDRLRLDKYLFLIRCYVAAAFEVFLEPASQGEENGAKKRKREAEPQGVREKRRRRRKGKREEPELDGEAEQNEQEEREPGKRTEEDGEGSKAAVKYPGLSAYVCMLEEGPLCPRDFDPDQVPVDDGAGGTVVIPHGPDGLRYHLIDIWIDELEKVLDIEDVDEEGPESSGIRCRIKGGVPMELLLHPIEMLRTKSVHKPVRKRAAETLQDERLVEWGVIKKERKESGDGDGDGDEDEWGGFGDN